MSALRRCLLVAGHDGRHGYKGDAAAHTQCEHVEKEFLGHAVVDGRIRFLSVSAMEKYDPRSEGCPRKWWWRYVKGIKDDDVETPEQVAAKQKGTDLHAEVERYLKTGEKVLGKLAMRGMHMLPDPGPDLLIELEDNRIGPDAPLRAAGIPVIIKVDCVHERGVNKGAADFEDAYDPPGTIEVIDWKRKGKGKDRQGNFTGLDRNELVSTIQMAGYGTYFGSRLSLPDRHPVRLSHGYFVEQPLDARKVTKLHVIGECRATWEYADALARRMVETARETDVENVDGQVSSCNAYGGCPHRQNCSTYQRKSLEGAFTGENMSLLQQITGVAPAAAPAPAAPAPYAAPASMPPPWGSAPAAQPTPPQYAPPPIAQVAPPPAAAPQVTLDMRAALEAEEAQRRAAQASQPIPGFTEACAYIATCGKGTPTLTGAAAQMFARAGGQAVAPDATFPGSGDVGRMTIDDPVKLIALACELHAYLSAQAAAAAPPTPAPVTHVVHSAPATYAPTVSVLPPDAPASNPAIAARPVETAPAGPPPLPAPPVPKKRAKKAAQPAGIATSPGAAPTEAPATTDSATTDHATTDLEVFVDCYPNGDFEDLRPYVDSMLRALTERYCTSGIPDVRCAPKDGPLGYNGWKGAIAAFVRTSPPAPGTYFLDTRFNEIATEVADAMRAVCDASGALYVRGIR